MKRTRSDIDNILEIVICNVDHLPLEVLFRMISFLSDEDITSLCQTNIKFSQVCSEYNLIAERDALQKLKTITPYGELLDTAQKQLAAAKRGQTTCYRIVFNRTSNTPGFAHVDGISELKMGYIPNCNIYVHLRGSPPAAGTKLWLFGIILLIQAPAPLGVEQELPVYINIKDDIRFATIGQLQLLFNKQESDFPFAHPVLSCMKETIRQLIIQMGLPDADPERSARSQTIRIYSKMYNDSVVKNTPEIVRHYIGDRLFFVAFLQQLSLP